MKIKNWLVIMLIMMSFGCSKSDDTIDTQNKAIVDFLTQKQYNYVDLKGVHRYTLSAANDSGLRILR